jgi:hypothetical protein
MIISYHMQLSPSGLVLAYYDQLHLRRRRRRIAGEHCHTSNHTL